jgi:hypothetical protein
MPMVYVSPHQIVYVCAIAFTPFVRRADLRQSSFFASMKHACNINAKHQLSAALV